MTETKQDRKYKNPPLKSVGFEIRFPTLLTISDNIPPFQASIREILPEYYTQNIPRPYSGGIIDEQWWVFKSSDDDLSLKIKNSSIALTTTIYEDFILFFDVIKFIFNLFFKRNEINRFLRIGLRYTNRHDFDDTESNMPLLLKYFKLKHFIFEKEDPINEFRVRYVLKEEDYRMVVSEDYRKTTLGKYSYLFDFDNFVTENVNRSNYLEIFKDLHKNILKTFENYITDDYRDDIGRVEE